LVVFVEWMRVKGYIIIIIIITDLYSAFRSKDTEALEWTLDDVKRRGMSGRKIEACGGF